MPTSFHTGSGSSKPFSSRKPRSSVSTTDSVSRRANGPIRISPGLGELLEPRCDVHSLAGCERRVRLVRHDLPRFDPDPRFEAETVDGVEDRHGSPDGALGVVLVRGRNPERRHDGVAGELLDDAAVRRYALRNVLEEGVDAAPNDLRIARGDKRGRADEIDEEHGCELAFHPVIVVTRWVSTRRAPDHPLASARARSQCLQGVRRAGRLPDRTGRGGRVRDRPRLRGALRTPPDRSRT